MTHRPFVLICLSNMRIYMMMHFDLASMLTILYGKTFNTEHHSKNCFPKLCHACHICKSHLDFFFCVQCDDHAKSSGRWLLGSPPSTVVRQFAHIAWCPVQCLQAKTVGVLSPGVGRSEECAQEFAHQSHIHSGLNQQDPISSGVFLAHSD